MKGARRVSSPGKIRNEEIHVNELRSVLDTLQNSLQKAEGLARESREQSRQVISEILALSAVALVVALFFKRQSSG
jgi:hypothetical protein